MSNQEEFWKSGNVHDLGMLRANPPGKRQEAARVERVEQQQGLCPFRRGMTKDCRGNGCALFDGQGCGLSGRRRPQKGAGRSCPFMTGECTTKCSLYDGGCLLAVRKGQG